MHRRDSSNLLVFHFPYFFFFFLRRDYTLFVEIIIPSGFYSITLFVGTRFLRKHQPGLIDPSHAHPALCDVTRRNRSRPAEDVAWRDRRLRQRQFNRVNAPVLELYSRSSTILERIKVWRISRILASFDRTLS